MSGKSPQGKSIKDQNRWQLWLVIAANTLFVYGIVQANAIELSGIKVAFTKAENLAPVGFALLITTVLSNFLSAEMKACLVFLRWSYVLPGHRAFSTYGPRDPRVDMTVLSKALGPELPSDPHVQNKLWYRLFQTVKNAPPIFQQHRDFLLLRDYAGIALLFLTIYGGCALILVSSGKVSLVYIALLVAQLLIVRQAASNAGIRLVTNVMAMVSVSEIRKHDDLSESRLARMSSALDCHSHKGSNRSQDGD